ncbi:hypothetical protein OIE68_31990 [Nocardia vinacea]|uniref:hypothetical protein n=1 Tax=Nocardia vinacea TaxID=96468 RepID=UPI002E0D1225|nr:hypothetical protein OIE68_31990 [Nocardia vinacea]
MPDPASIDDILEALELGGAAGEKELEGELRAAFGIADDQDLRQALADTAPALVLAAVATAAAPVATMIRELYEWLGQLAGTKSTANLSVSVSDDQMNEMKLDLEQYAAYERAIIEDVLEAEFIPSRLPPRTPLVNCHDAHFPPTCFGRNDDPSAETKRCRSCEAGVAEKFERLERGLDIVARVMTATPSPSAEGPRRSPRRSTDAEWFLRRLPDILPEVRQRTGKRDGCSYSNDFVAHYIRDGLTDLEACFEIVSVQQLRKFFDLPYWKKRWQIYEIWVVRIVMDSYGTRRWSPRLTGTDWDLKAGSVNPLAIATSLLGDGRELRFYYQHQSTPPASLVAGVGDRPEILVTIAEDPAQGAEPGAKEEKVLIAVEAKARLRYGLQDMKSSTIALIEWQPHRVLGASYFSLTSDTDNLHTQTMNGCEIALAERLRPGSQSASKTAGWLKACWRDLVAQRIGIVAVDISGSMKPGAAAQRIDMIGKASGIEGLDLITDFDQLLLTTFGSHSPRLVPLAALTSSAITDTGVDLQPSMPTEAVAAAANAWIEQIESHYPVRQRVDLHLFTDGSWSNADVRALDICREAGMHIQVHLVPTEGRSTPHPGLSTFLGAATGFPPTAETQG